MAPWVDPGEVSVIWAVDFFPGWWWRIRVSLVSRGKCSEF
jgi:hypothetical protein